MLTNNVHKSVQLMDKRSVGVVPTPRRSWATVKRNFTMTVPPVYPSSVRVIPLTQGRVALIDAADYPLVASYRWYYNVGYAVACIPGRGHHTVRMHRLLLGNPEGYEVDHRNRNKLDNRRVNLRVASHSDNQHNVGLRRDNSSGYKGVSTRKQKRGTRYWARIIVNRRHINLGTYGTPEEAALAYNTAATRYFGAFAATNEVPDAS